jgi:uncharacterized membrane protein
MKRRLGWLWLALILLFGVGYQLLVYSAVAGGQTETVRLALPFLPLLVLAWWVATRADNRLLWAFILLVGAMAIYIMEHQQEWGVAAAYGMPHAIIYLSLLWFFGRTLAQGAEPLVAHLARRVHGALPPAMVAYTRRVTCAWCIFFAMQLATSALLFKFASLNVWSLFVNVLNVPLLLLMFIGEYGYRTVRHREFPHASLLDGIRAFSNHSNGGKDSNHSAHDANAASAK